jgi:hypothetical protein
MMPEKHECRHASRQAFIQTGMHDDSKIVPLS